MLACAHTHVHLCHDRPCPSCGYCPCCGRGGYQFWPWTYPWRPRPVIPCPPPQPIWVHRQDANTTQAINALAGGRVYAR